MKKKLVKIITPIIILGIIVLSFIILNKNKGDVSKDVTGCIGKNSELYVQLGCHACGIQEDIFGENYTELTVIDCFYEREKCSLKNISVTPTWIINGKTHLGVQSLELLKNLTGC